jgi:hypothetical protein
MPGDEYLGLGAEILSALHSGEHHRRVGALADEDISRLEKRIRDETGKSGISKDVALH